MTTIKKRVTLTVKIRTVVEAVDSHFVATSRVTLTGLGQFTGSGVGATRRTARRFAQAAVLGYVATAVLHSARFGGAL